MEKKRGATKGEGEGEGKDEPWQSKPRNFLKRLAASEGLPEGCQDRQSLPDLIKGILKVERVESGRVSCSFPVEPTIVNRYRTLHGGAVATVTGMLAAACVETVAGKQEEFFLGETSISYLYAARLHDEVKAEACVTKRGRSIVFCCVELRTKGSEKLCYTARLTFYPVPAAKI
ncbi:uncharacterized protein LOC116247795 isoform X1 [Nymphaea colorata]|nr:uncharacterized protein LOC116247795 isoform X1 [Nymphaea colorata]